MNSRQPRGGRRGGWTFLKEFLSLRRPLIRPTDLIIWLLQQNGLSVVCVVTLCCDCCCRRCCIRCRKRGGSGGGPLPAIGYGRVRGAYPQTEDFSCRFQVMWVMLIVVGCIAVARFCFVVLSFLWRHFPERRTKVKQGVGGGGASTLLDLMLFICHCCCCCCCCFCRLACFLKAAAAAFLSL